MYLDEKHLDYQLENTSGISTTTESIRKLMIRYLQFLFKKNSQRYTKFMFPNVTVSHLSISQLTIPSDIIKHKHFLPLPMGNCKSLSSIPCFALPTFPAKYIPSNVSILLSTCQLNISLVLFVYFPVNLLLCPVQSQL